MDFLLQYDVDCCCQSEGLYYQRINQRNSI